MKYVLTSKMLFMMLIAVLALLGCSTQFRFNAMTCPQDYSEAMIEQDLQSCHYYDYNAIKAGEKLPDSCAACMQEKGYEVNQ